LEKPAGPTPAFFCSASFCPAGILEKAEELAAKMRSILMGAHMHSSISVSAPSAASGISALERSSRACYANAMVRFAEKQSMSVHMYARMFSGICAPGGESVERRALSNALKRRGIRLVQWIDEHDERVVPLVLPHPFRMRKQSAVEVSGPCALIEIHRD